MVNQLASGGHEGPPVVNVVNSVQAKLFSCRTQVTLGRAPKDRRVGLGVGDRLFAHDHIGRTPASAPIATAVGHLPAIGLRDEGEKHERLLSHVGAPWRSRTADTSD